MSGDRYKISNQNAVHFLTLTVVHWIDLFTRKEYNYILTDSLNYCIKEKGLEVVSYVIMPSHVHLVCRVNEPFQLSDVLRDFKKFTSKKIVEAIMELPESRREWLLDKFSFEAKRTGRTENYKVWKDDNHAVEVVDYISIQQKVDYIHNNPVLAQIVRNPQDYVFSSAGDYSEQKGYVEVLVF